MDKVLCLGIGSLIGGFARWFLTDAIQALSASRFPFGTLAVNLSGCLLIGILHGVGESRPGPHGRLLLMTGFCGAFTTFSTWMLESSVMLDRGDWRGVLAYMTLSVVLGFVLFRLGSMATHLRI